MKVIIITGSVGTGKTILSKNLSKKLDYKYIDIKNLKGISAGYDKKKKCRIIDVKKLNKLLIKEIESIKKCSLGKKSIIKKLKKNNKKIKGIIIDSHLSHYLPSKYVDICYITKCNLKTLEKRLKKRKYSKEKIRENLDCEIFDVCYNEALENKHKVKIVWTDKKI